MTKVPYRMAIMTKLWDVLVAVAGVVPTMLPFLAWCWVAAAVLAVLELGWARYKETLPERPMRLAALKFLGWGSLISIYFIARAAQSDGLIPPSTSAMVATAAVFISSWMSNGKLRIG